MFHNSEGPQCPSKKIKIINLIFINKQKEIQYPGWHKDNIGKEFLSGENDVSRNIEWGIADKINIPRAVSYSH